MEKEDKEKILNHLEDEKEFDIRVDYVKKGYANILVKAHSKEEAMEKAESWDYEDIDYPDDECEFFWEEAEIEEKD